MPIGLACWSDLLRVIRQGEYFEVDGPEDVFYHDVPLEKQAKAVAALKPHACK